MCIINSDNIYPGRRKMGNFGRNKGIAAGGE